MPGDDDVDDRPARSFSGEDLSRSVFRNVNLRDAKMVDVVLSGADLSGLIDGLRINGVEVAPLVDAELRRAHPDRIALLARNPAGLQHAWESVEAFWAGTIERARQLPATSLRVRVDDEWSLTETLRHLLFVTDAWISRMVLGAHDPFHPWGLPPSFVLDASGYGIDRDADPTFDEVLEVRLERMASVRRLLDGVTVDDLDRRCTPPDVPGYPPAGERGARDCIWTVLEEEWWHHRFAARDLATLIG